MTEFPQSLLAASETNHQNPSWLDYRIHPPTNLRAIVQRAIDIFLLSKNPNGTMGGIGWWQSANGYTAIALTDLWTGEKRNYSTLNILLRNCERVHAGYINEFNDDSLWWALCCLHMYSLGGEEWFIEKAKKVRRHVLDSRSIVGRGQVKFREYDMEGGCYWKTTPSQGQINSISTGLFAELNVRLALIEIRANLEEKDPHSQSLILGEKTSAREYIDAARCSLGWILRTRYQPKDAIVLDGFKVEVDVANDWTFTYNTGVAIAVCALLFEVTREECYMALATHMAWKSMRRDQWVEQNGVLTEKGAYGPGKHDPSKNNDAVGFKSVLMRQLGTLYQVIQRTGYQTPKVMATAEMIKKFVNINFHSLQERDTNSNGQYGPWWNGPFVMSTSHSQMAVLDVMAVAALVNR